MSEIVEGPLTSVALCWRVERADGAGLGLTSHDRSVLRDGTEYTPAPGMLPSTVTRGLGLDPPSGEISGALSSETLSDRDLEVGRWDGASVRLFAVDWTGPDAGEIELVGGELGEVSIEGEAFSAELRGAASQLERAVCPTTSPECRAQLGDKHCRVDLAGRVSQAKVVSSSGGELTLDRSQDDAVLLGRLRYLSGANCGRATVIIAVDGNVVRVRDLPRATVENGCRVELLEGCDKRLQTCAERFANAVNFRGEPHLPGNDLLTRYPGA